jgi:hypothetical protein
LSGTAARYVDFAILRGDPSDGLPGVAGVGEKTAARLVRDYPSLDALVAGRDRLPPASPARWRAPASTWTHARGGPVATRLDVSSTAPASPDVERLQELAGRHSLRGPVRRLLAAMRDAGPFSAEPPAAGSARPRVRGTAADVRGAPSAGDARPRTLAWFLHRLDTVSSPSRGLLRLA